MNRKHFQFILLSLVIVLGVRTQAVEFEGGAGEPDDPYLIGTAEQLLGADFAQPGVYYRLCCDIDLAGRAVQTIRDMEAHLDGGGYAIRHARIEPSRHFQGFFGSVSREATITNLTLADFGITVPDTDDTTQVDYVGGLAGVNAGTITNCSATGWVVAHGGGWRIGGLVGANGGWTDRRGPEHSWTGVISDCHFEGTISSQWGGTMSLGGLAGWNSGIVANCYAAGVVSGKKHVGGLVGWNNEPGSIANCYATTTVFAEFGGGGLVGWNAASLTRCYASGLVTGELRGGLIGMEGTYAGMVTGCFWDTYATNCQTSGGGMPMGLARKWDPQTYARNGWSGDPNWVMEPYADYPRLFWEGTKGEPIPEPAVWSFAGSGTEDDPYQIETPDQLAELAGASILWDRHFVLVHDVGLSAWPESEYRPIGICPGSEFSGSFDGQGHTIHSLNVDYGDVPVWNLGLFGYVTGQVRNLHVEIMAFETGANSRRIGLLAGTCDGGLIANCSAQGSISVGANSEGVGQLVGYSTGQVVDCTSNATVAAGEGSTDIGGLIGLDRWDGPPRRRQ